VLLNLQIVLREGLLFVVLLACGAYPASCLSSAPGLTRLAFAPAAGLAVTASGLAFLSLFLPLGAAMWWGLLPIGVLSVFFAVRRLRRSGTLRPDGRMLGVLAIVGLIAATLFSLPLIKRDSFGPIGAGIFDGPGYIAYIDGYAKYRNNKPLLGQSPQNWAEPSFDGEAWGPSWNLLTRYGWGFKWQHTSSTTIPAAVAAAVGWPPWTMLSPFMVVLVAIGAIGTAGLARLVTAGARLPALLAGLLFAGPMLFQIHTDGSEGLIAGIAVLPGIFAAGILALRRPTWSAVVMLGIFLAGMQAIYPELFPYAAGSAAVVALASALLEVRRGTRIADLLKRALPKVLALVAFAVVFSPRTATWLVNYLYSEVANPSSVAGLVHYNIPVRLVPGWLAGLRDFYSFAFGTPPTSSGQIIWGYLVPALMVLVAAFGLRRFRWGWVLVAPIAVAIVQAVGVYHSLSCTYCVQRSLLGLAPVLPTLFAAGVAAIWSLRGRRLEAALTGPVARIAAGAIALLVLVGTGLTLKSQEHRVVDYAWLSSPDLSPISDGLSKLPGSGPLELDGFDSVPFWAWGELPTTYAAAEEASDRRISIPAERNEWGGFSYIQTRPRGNPAYDPSYQWVLTRLRGLDAGRKEIAHAGPLSLQRRRRPFDVSVLGGVVADTDRRDRSGYAWINTPGMQEGLTQGLLSFVIAADGKRQATLRLVLESPLRNLHLQAPGIKQHLTPGKRLVACVPISGTGAQRFVDIQVTPPMPALASVPYDPAPQIPHMVRLVSAVADPGHCSVR